MLDDKKDPIEANDAPPVNTDVSKPLWRTPAFWQAVFSGCLLVNALVTYGLLRGQYQLVRQQVVGVQAADVSVILSMYPNNALLVTLDPRGVVAARNVRFKFRAVRQRIPALTDIEKGIDETIILPVFSKESRFTNNENEYSLPGLTPNEFEAIRRTEQTVKVEGEFSYDNGFGDVRRFPVCQYWLSGIPNATEDKGGANGFYPCEGFEIRMNNVLKARSEGAQ